MEKDVYRRVGGTMGPRGYKARGYHTKNRDLWYMFTVKVFNFPVLLHCIHISADDYLVLVNS